MSSIPSIAIQIDIIGCPHINEVAREMCELATRLRVNVKADFNGTPAIAFVGQTPSEVVADWDKTRDVLQKLAKSEKW